MKAARTKEEIDRLRAKAVKYEGTFKGDTFENGIIQAIDWILGEQDINPMKGAKSLSKSQKSRPQKA